MKRFLKKLPKLLPLLGLFFLVANSANAQTVTFDIKSVNPNIYEGCAPYAIEFLADVTNLPTGVTVTTMRIEIDVATTIEDNEWNNAMKGPKRNVTFPLPRGTFNPILEVAFSDGRAPIRRPLTKQIIVYGIPKADFTVDEPEQCFEGNRFCFENLSTRSVDNHPIIKYDWDFGDGSFPKYNTDKDPCHSYQGVGRFDIILTVEDEKGCSHTELKVKNILVYPKIGVKFRVRGPVGCPCTDITFINQTEIDFDKVEKWIWDWGTGPKNAETFYADNQDHVDNWWTNFTKEYCKDGYTSPKLVVFTDDGCRDSLILKDAIRAVNYDMDVIWTPDTPCFADNNVRFVMKPRPNATQWLWTFGDPASMQLNFNNESWTPQHQFVGGPGFYNVSLSILEPPCPVRTQTFCWVKLTGPAAAINLPAPPAGPFQNNCEDPREIPIKDFERIKYDECYREALDVSEINYVFATFSRSLDDSYFVYCNAKIDPNKGGWHYDADPNGNTFCEEGRDGAGGNVLGRGDSVVKWLDTLEDPIPGVNGDWRYTYNTYAQTFQPTWNNLMNIPMRTELLIEGEYNLLRDHYVVIDTIVRNGNNVLRFDTVFFNPGDTAVTNRFNGKAIRRSLILNGTYKVWRKGSVIDTLLNQTYHNVNGIYYANNLIDIKSGGGNPDTLQYSSNGGRVKGQAEYKIYHPFVTVHKTWVNGRLHFFRGSSPIEFKRNNGQKDDYFPPMYPGTTPPDCGKDWETMHDSNKVKYDCKAPNWVKFTNNSTKYRVFGRGKNAVPPHKGYAWDNIPSAWHRLATENLVDSCRENPNFPWTSDSMTFFWDFGDNSDECTTYYDVNRNILVKGDNPSGDKLLCKYSELVAPEHLYIEDGCWTAILEVYDPITDCRSTATQTIAMEHPDAGPADPKGILGVEDVNFYNQPVILEDEDDDEFRKGLELGRGGAPCVGNAINPYFQRINIDATLPTCAKPYWEMIFNRPDDCEAVPCLRDGNFELVDFEIVDRGSLHGNGVARTHDVEFIVAGVQVTKKATGRARINALGFLESVVMTDPGVGYPNGAKARMVFVDSTQIGFDPGDDPIIVFGYEEINDEAYVCNWIPNMILMMIGMQWSYTTAGCKTPGLRIFAGDCHHTFFYENYRYYLDANANYVMHPNPQLMAADNPQGYVPRQNIVDAMPEPVCVKPTDPSLLPTKLPYRSIISVEDYERNDPLAPGDDPVCDAGDSLRNFKLFVTRTFTTCGLRDGAVLRSDSLEMLPNGLEPVKDGDPTVVNLRDTMMIQFNQPGKYLVSTSAKSVHGKEFCFGGMPREVWIGQFQCFRYTDDVVCGPTDITFYDSVYYWHRGGLGFCENQPDLTSPYFIGNNPTCVDTANFFYKPYWVRKVTWKDRFTPYNYPWEVDGYSEEIAWDFNAPRYLTDENGNYVLDQLGQRIRMKEHMRTMDSNLVDTFIKPNLLGTARSNSVTMNYVDLLKAPTYLDAVGNYDVTLWAKDSMGCWMPYTIYDAVRVVGVKANFVLASDSVLTCTPAGGIYVDSTRIYEDKTINPKGWSYDRRKDNISAVEDSIKSWRWEWFDNRDDAFLQDAIHNYLKPGKYSTRLTVETWQGCTDFIEYNDIIRVIGPNVDFDIEVDAICDGTTVVAIDKTTGVDRGDAKWNWEMRSLHDTTKSRRQVSFGEERVNLGFRDTGKYTIILRVTADVIDPLTKIKKNCQAVHPDPLIPDDVPVNILVRGRDSLLIAASDTLVCPGDQIQFQLDANSADTMYSTVKWEFFKESSPDSVFVSLDKTPADLVDRIYPAPGRYKVRLSGEGDDNCPLKDSIWISVKQVEAKIKIDPDSSDVQLGNYLFLNESENAVVHNWKIIDLDDGSVKLDEQRFNYDPLKYHDFVPGDYEVILAVADDTDETKACRDEDTVKIKVEPIGISYNVFTPNGDGINDWFTVDLQAAPFYDIKIYNRWGGLIYQADQDDDINCYLDEERGNQVCEFWDGTNRFTGLEVPAGTYFYVFRYKFKGEEEYEIVYGSATVVR